MCKLLIYFTVFPVLLHLDFFSPVALSYSPRTVFLMWSSGCCLGASVWPISESPPTCSCIPQIARPEGSCAAKSRLYFLPWELILVTVNLEILATKIFSVSRSIDILANLNFSDLVLGNFSSNFIIIVMVGSSLLAVLLCKHLVISHF